MPDPQSLLTECRHLWVYDPSSGRVSCERCHCDGVIDNEAGRILASWARVVEHSIRFTVADSMKAPN